MAIANLAQEIRQARLCLKRTATRVSKSVKEKRFKAKTHPYPYERQLRDSRINRIFEGTNEILRLALKRPLKNLGLLSEYAASRIASRFGATPTLDVDLHERLQGHARYFEKHVRELKEGAEQVIRAYRKEIVERQQELERLGDMAIELFATACVIGRTQRLLDEHGEAGCVHELALCDLFVVEAGRRFRARRGALTVGAG